MTRALITGMGGQDGPYLAEYLLSRGHEVWGMRMREGDLGDERLLVLSENPRFHLIYGNLRDEASVKEVVQESQPDKVFNLASQSAVGLSFTIPEETMDINFGGLKRLADAALARNPYTRIYQASTSEMFGKTPPPQHEASPFSPVSPYGLSKLKAHEEIVVGYRRDKNAYICSGILFNHESPYRGENFVTRKISIALAKIQQGLQNELLLGNLEARRDWGFAGDYVRAMDVMLEQDAPDDFVIATGESHSIRDFVTEAANALSMPITWSGTGVEEVGMDDTGKIIIRINPEFYRPAEVDETRGDSNKAARVLGWKPTVSFSELVRMMVMYDLERLKR